MDAFEKYLRERQEWINEERKIIKELNEELKKEGK